MTSQPSFGRSPSRMVALGAVALIAAAAIIFILVNRDRGSVVLTIPEAQSRVFIDNDRRAVTEKENEVLSFRLSPGEHEIIVSRDGHWPWFKNINTIEGETLRFTSFSVPQDVNPAIMPENNPDFPRIVGIIEDIKTPSRAIPSLTQDGNTQLWVNPDNNGVYAEWVGSEENLPEKFCVLELCDPLMHFFTGTSEIRNAAFMGGRDDVAIVATANGVYLIEIVAIPSQNFQPIYLGDEPQFATRDENSIYIYDSDRLMVVVL